MILSPNALVHPDLIQGELGRLDESLDQTIGFINRASDIIEKRCRRHFRRRDYIVTVDGSGTEFLRIPYRPIHTIAHLNVDTTRTFGVETELAATDYTFDEETIFYTTDLTQKSVKIELNAGYDIIRFSQSDEPITPDTEDVWFDGLIYQKWDGVIWQPYDDAAPMPECINLAMLEYFSYTMRRVVGAEVGVTSRDIGGSNGSMSFEMVMPSHVREMIESEIFYG